jgi:hypothetical protein
MPQHTSHAHIYYPEKDKVETVSIDLGPDADVPINEIGAVFPKDDGAVVFFANESER